MNAERPMRVALVGCGGMGRHHLAHLKGLPDFEVVAVCDIVEAAANRAGDEFGVARRLTDFDAMFREVQPELVVVATQTRGHLAPTIAALERGVSVLCEKPIAIDLSEADAMIAAAEKSGAKLAVHQQNHVHPGIRKAKALVETGLIGEPVLVRGRAKAGRLCGNEFMEMGTHYHDMMIRFGGAPEWCSATIWHRNRLASPADIMEAKEMSPRDRDSGLVMGSRARATFGFPGGVLGDIAYLDFKQTNNRNYGVDIIGTSGQLAVRTSGNLADSLWHLPRPMEGYPSELGDWTRIDLVDVGLEEPMTTMYRGMASAIRRNGAPPCDGKTGRTALEMVMGIYESHRQDGRRIPFPLENRRHPLERWRAEAAS